MVPIFPDLLQRACNKEVEALVLIETNRRLALRGLMSTIMTWGFLTPRLSTHLSSLGQLFPIRPLKSTKVTATPAEGTCACIPELAERSTGTSL